jgi:hypothetical protein
MQATTAFRGPGISKSRVAVVVAVLVAFALGAAGGYIAKAMSLPLATARVTSVVGMPGASGPGSAWNYSSRHGGTQSVEGPAPASVAPASFRDPGSQRGGPRL